MRLLVRMDVKSARHVMFASYFYLMVVLLALYLDRTPDKNEIRTAVAATTVNKN